MDGVLREATEEFFQTRRRRAEAARRMSVALLAALTFLLLAEVLGR